MTEHRQRGRAALKSIGLGLGLIAAALAGWYGYVEYRRNYWDDMVREMCAKDGGLQVIERVHVSPAEYQTLLGAFGELGLRLESTAPINAPFFLRDSLVRLRPTNPEVARYEQQVVRRIDRKVIAVLRTYMRIGGDAEFVDNSSSTSCKAPHGNWFSQVISTD